MRAVPIALLITLTLASPSASAAEPAPVEDVAPEACADEPASGSCRDAARFVARHRDGDSLVVFKAKRLLYLFRNGRPLEKRVDLRDYDRNITRPVMVDLRFPIPIALSRRDTGHKQWLSDLRTPEGEYRICASSSQSQFTHFLSISYPGTKDVDEAVAKRRFPAKELERVARTQRARGCPDFFSALGGAVGIHGVNTGLAAAAATAEQDDPSVLQVTTSDWTWGCVAVENRHIRFLAKEVRVGTPILIVP